MIDSVLHTRSKNNDMALGLRGLQFSVQRRIIQTEKWHSIYAKMVGHFFKGIKKKDYKKDYPSGENF